MNYGTKKVTLKHLRTLFPFDPATLARQAGVAIETVFHLERDEDDGEYAHHGFLQWSRGASWMSCPVDESSPRGLLCSVGPQQSLLPHPQDASRA